MARFPARVPARRRARSRPRRVLAALAWIAGAALAAALGLVSAAVLIARTEIGRGWLRQVVLERARATLPGLELGRIGGDFVRDLSLDDVTVFDARGRRAIHVDRVAVRFELLPLLRRTVHLTELQIDQPTILGRPDAGGALNLARLTAPAQAPAPAPAGGRRDEHAAPSAWRVQIDRLRVYDGSADIVGADGGRLQVTALALDARVSAGASAASATIAALSARVRGGSAGAFVSASGRLALGPGADGALGLGEYALTADARDVELPKLEGAPPSRRPALALDARGRGVPLAPGSRAELALDAPATRLDGIALGPVRLRASSDGARWTLEPARVRASGASLSLAARGEGDRIAGELDARVDGGLARGGRSRRSDIRGHGRLTVRLRGSLPRKLELAAELDARGISAGALRLGQAALRAQASLTRSRAGAPASQARLALRAEGTLAGLAAGGARVQAASLSAALEGRVTAPRGTVHVAARGVEAGGAPRIDTLTVDAGGDGRSLRVRGAARGPHLQADLAAHGQLGPRAGDVTVERLSLSADTRAGKQTLALARPATLAYRARDRVAVSSVDVRATGALVTGAATLGGFYALGPARDGTLAEVELGLRHVTATGFDPIDADGRVTLTRDRATAALEARLARARISLTADVPVTAAARGVPRLAARGPIQLRLHADPIPLRDLPRLERRLARAGIEGGVLDVTASVDGDVANPTATATVHVRDAAFHNVIGVVADARTRSLPGAGLSLRLETRPRSVHADGELLLRQARVLHVDAGADIDLAALLAGAAGHGAGGVRLDVPFRASAEIPEVELASLADFSSALQGTRGRLSGRIDLGGTLGNPSGRADVTVAGASLGGVPFRKVLLHGDVGADRVALAVNLVQAAGGDLYGEGHVDLRGAHALQARLGATNLDLTFARPFLPSVREIAGALQATVEATGTLARPVVHGSLALAHGRLGLVGQPTFEDVTLSASLTSERLEIGRLEMRSGKGTLTANGHVTLAGLEPQTMVLHAQAHDFLVAATGTTGARVDGELAVEAARRQAVIEGKVRVPRAMVWLPSVALGGGRNLQPTGPRRDVRFVDRAAIATAEHEAEARRARAAHPTELSLEAQAGPVQVRSKDIDLDLDSQLRLTTRDGEPRLTGNVRVRRGSINVSGQKLEFERGDLTFDGSPEPNPTLDIRLTRQFAEARVVIEIRGTLKKPDLRLSSDPPLYQDAQIVSLLLTGSPGGQPSSGRPFDPTAVVATMVLGKLADAVAPQIGLDVVRVSTVDQTTPTGTTAVATGPQAPLTDTRVEVGKYVSDRVYLSYAHVFGASENTNINEAHVEYRVTRRWIIQTVFGDAGVGSLDALWTYRY